MNRPIVAGEVVSTLPQLVRDAAELRVDNEAVFSPEDADDLRFLAEILEAVKAESPRALIQRLDRA